MPEEIFSKLSWFLKERVATAKVMVVGCGALGNEVLKNLVLFGIEHIVVVDFDRVEWHNLTRSILFRSEDAEQGRSKVEVVSERLRELNSNLRILPICGDVQYDVGLGLIRHMDVVIGCVDSRWARYCINRLCMRAGVPWVDGGIEGLEGTARVFGPGKNCYACNLGTEGLNELARRMPCSGVVRKNEEAGRAATTPVIASIIGAVQVQEALKIINENKSENGKLTSLCGKMFYYEGEHLTTKLVDFKAYDEDCPVHEQWKDIKHSELTSVATVGNALEILKNELRASQVTILLTNDWFVDFVEDGDSGQIIQTMCPSHLVNISEKLTPTTQQFNNSTIQHKYCHEFREIDDSFPYMDISLSQLGIPEGDILHVRAENNEFYIELCDGKNI